MGAAVGAWVGAAGCAERLRCRRADRCLFVVPSYWSGGEAVPEPGELRRCPSPWVSLPVGLCLGGRGVCSGPWGHYRAADGSSQGVQSAQPAPPYGLQAGPLKPVPKPGQGQHREANDRPAWSKVRDCHEQQTQRESEAPGSGSPTPLFLFSFYFFIITLYIIFSLFLFYFFRFHFISVSLFLSHIPYFSLSFSPTSFFFLCFFFKFSILLFLFYTLF